VSEDQDLQTTATEMAVLALIYILWVALLVSVLIGLIVLGAHAYQWLV